MEYSENPDSQEVATSEPSSGPDESPTFDESNVNETSTEESDEEESLESLVEILSSEGSSLATGIQESSELDEGSIKRSLKHPRGGLATNSDVWEADAFQNIPAVKATDERNRRESLTTPEDYANIADEEVTLQNTGHMSVSTSGKDRDHVRQPAVQTDKFRSNGLATAADNDGMDNGRSLIKRLRRDREANDALSGTVSNAAIKSAVRQAHANNSAKTTKLLQARSSERAFHAKRSPKPTMNTGTVTADNRKSAKRQGVPLPLPEITEAYPGGRLDFAMHMPKPRRFILQSGKQNKCNMISKSDDHLIKESNLTTRHVKSTKDLIRHKPRKKTKKMHPPQIRLSEGAVTINERVERLRNECNKLRGNTQFAQFNAVSDTKLAKRKHREPTRRKSFLKTLQKDIHKKRGLGKGFMTTVGKIVPHDHSIVLIGQSRMRSGHSVKTVVLGTLLIDDENVGSGDAILTVPQNQKDLITGKVSMSTMPQKSKTNPNPTRKNENSALLRKQPLLERKNILSEHTTKLPTKSVSNSAMPHGIKDLIMGKIIKPMTNNKASSDRGGPSHAIRQETERPKMFVPDFMNKENTQKNAFVKEDIARTFANEQDAALVRRDRPSSDSDVEIDESMLEKRIGQRFTIGKNSRPRQISKAGKVLKKNILWRVPTGKGPHDIKSGEVLQRRMKGIRLDIRRTTDISSHSWVSKKPIDSKRKRTAKTLPNSSLSNQSTLDLPVINSKQMLEIQDALIGDPYDLGNMRSHSKSGKSTRQLVCFQTDANHYDYIPSSASIQSSVFQQALSGFVYIGERIKKVLKKNAREGSSGKNSSSYQEILPESAKGLESVPYAFNSSQQSSYDEVNIESSEAGTASTGASHEYDIPTTSDVESRDSTESSVADSDHESQSDLTKSSVANSDDKTKSDSTESSVADTDDKSQSNSTLLSKTYSNNTISVSYDSVQQHSSAESVTEKKSFLTPSAGVKSSDVNQFKGIHVERPPKIVIGRRHGSKQNIAAQFSSNQTVPIYKESVRMSPSCDSISLSHPSRRTNVCGGSRRKTRFKQNISTKQVSQLQRSQSFHNYSSVVKGQPSRQRHDFSDGSCGDSVYNNSRENTFSTAKTKESSIHSQRNQTAFSQHKKKTVVKTATPKVSARYSSDNSNAVTSHITTRPDVSPVITESMSSLPESSSESNRSHCSSISSDNTYSQPVTCSSAIIGDDPSAATEEDETDWQESGTECLSVIPEEMEHFIEVKQHGSRGRKINLPSDFSATTTPFTSNHSSITAFTSDSEFRSERSSSDSKSSDNQIADATRTINLLPKFNLLRPSCNSKHTKKAEFPDLKKQVEKYSNSSDYESHESDNKPDSWDISVNSTNGSPSPIVTDERFNDFSDDMNGYEDYLSNSVDECSAMATAGLEKRVSRGSKPIRKIRALLKYLRGDDLFLKTFAEKNAQVHDELSKLPSEECCMKTQISPFDFSSRLAGGSPKCGCIKRFEPFFEKLFEQNAYRPLAKRIVDFSIYEGLEIHNQTCPLYTEEDVDLLCDKLVYDAITKGVSEFSVTQSISNTMLEIKSEDLLDDMTISDVRGVVEEMIADVITDEVMQQGRRAVIVESFIKDSMPKVSARKTNHLNLRSMYREALKTAVIEETGNAEILEFRNKSTKSSSQCSQLSILTVAHDLTNNTSKHSVDSTSKSVPSKTSMHHVERMNTSEVALSESSNVLHSKASSASNPGSEAPHPSSRFARNHINSKLEPTEHCNCNDSSRSVVDLVINKTAAAEKPSECAKAVGQRKKAFLSIRQIFEPSQKAQSKSILPSKQRLHKESDSNLSTMSIKNGDENTNTGNFQEQSSTLLTSKKEQDIRSDDVDNESSCRTSAAHTNLNDVIKNSHCDSRRSKHSGNLGISVVQPLNKSESSDNLDSQKPDDECTEFLSPSPSSGITMQYVPILDASTETSNFKQTRSITPSQTATQRKYPGKPRLSGGIKDSLDLSTQKSLKTSPIRRSCNNATPTMSESPLPEKRLVDKSVVSTIEHINDSANGTTLLKPTPTREGNTKHAMTLFDTEPSVSSSWAEDAVIFPQAPFKKESQITKVKPVENSTSTLLSNQSPRMRGRDKKNDDISSENSMSVQRDSSGIQPFKVEVSMTNLPDTIPSNSTAPPKGISIIENNQNNVTSLKSESKLTKSNPKGCSTTRRTCNHVNIFLSCVHCRRKVFKSTKRLKHLSRKRKEMKLKDEDHETRKISIQSCLQQNQVTPFPSGGQISSHHNQKFNRNLHSYNYNNDSEAERLRSNPNIEGSFCSGYESSHMSLSSGSSMYGWQGEVVIGRNNPLFNQHHIKSNDQRGKMCLQIGLSKTESGHQPEVQCLYTDSPSYFVNSDQRIVIGGENTSAQPSAREKENATPVIHPCGCNKPTNQTPRSDCELDDEKIVEKVRRMFRPHSPVLQDSNLNKKGFGNGTKSQVQSDFVIEKSDASVQTSAREDSSFTSITSKDTSSPSETSVVSSSQDLDSDVESLHVIRESNKSISRKTRPLYSVRSKSAVGMYDHESISSSPHSSNETVSRTPSSIQNKKNSVLDLFDELRNELDSLGTIIDTSKIGRNREAGILSEARFEKCSQNGLTPTPTEKDIIKSHLVIQPSKTVSPHEETQYLRDDSSSDKSLDPTYINNAQKRSLANMFGKSIGSETEKSLRSRTHGEIGSDGCFKSSLCRSSISKVLKQSPLVSASPRGHKRMSRNDSYDGGMRKRLHSFENRERNPERVRTRSRPKITSHTAFPKKDSVYKYGESPTSAQMNFSERDVAQRKQLMSRIVIIGTPRKDEARSVNRSFSEPSRNDNMWRNSSAPLFKTGKGRPSITEDVIVPRQATDALEGTASIIETRKRSDSAAVSNNMMASTGNPGAAIGAPAQINVMPQMWMGQSQAPIGNAAPTIETPPQVNATPLMVAGQSRMPSGNAAAAFGIPGQANATPPMWTGQSQTPTGNVAAINYTPQTNATAPMWVGQSQTPNGNAAALISPPAQMNATAPWCLGQSYTPISPNAGTRFGVESEASNRTNVTTQVKVDKFGTDNRTNVITQVGVEISDKPRHAAVGEIPRRSIGPMAQIEKPVDRNWTVGETASALSRNENLNRMAFSDAATKNEFPLRRHTIGVTSDAIPQNNMLKHAVFRDAAEDIEIPSRTIRTRTNANTQTEIPEYAAFAGAAAKSEIPMRRHTIGITTDAVKQSKRATFGDDMTAIETPRRRSTIKRRSTIRAATSEITPSEIPELESAVSQIHRRPSTRRATASAIAHSKLPELETGENRIHRRRNTRRATAIASTPSELLELETGGNGIHRRRSTRRATAIAQSEPPELETNENGIPRRRSTRRGTAIASTPSKFPELETGENGIPRRRSTRRKTTTAIAQSELPELEARKNEIHRRRSARRVTMSAVAPNGIMKPAMEESDIPRRRLTIRESLSADTQTETPEGTDTPNPSQQHDSSESDQDRYSVESLIRRDRDYEIDDSREREALPQTSDIDSIASNDSNVGRRTSNRCLLRLPTKKERNLGHHVSEEEACTDVQTFSDETTEHCQYIREKKSRRRDKLRRRMSKIRLSRQQDSSFMDIIRRLFPLDNEANNGAGFETLIRVGAIIIIVMYAMHEEIFDYDRDFPT